MRMECWFVDEIGFNGVNNSTRELKFFKISNRTLRIEHCHIAHHFLIDWKNTYTNKACHRLKNTHANERYATSSRIEVDLATLKMFRTENVNVCQESSPTPVTLSRSTRHACDWNHWINDLKSTQTSGMHLRFTIFASITSDTVDGWASLENDDNIFPLRKAVDTEHKIHLNFERTSSWKSIEIVSRARYERALNRNLNILSKFGRNFE